MLGEVRRGGLDDGEAVVVVGHLILLLPQLHVGVHVWQVVAVLPRLEVLGAVADRQHVQPQTQRVRVFLGGVHQHTIARQRRWCSSTRTHSRSVVAGVASVIPNRRDRPPSY